MSYIAGIAWIVLANIVLVDNCLSQQQDKPAEQASRNWGSWRGPMSTGVSQLGDPPLEWNEDKNIRWKVATEGRGHSSPIVWGDHVFITSAIPVGPELESRYSGAPGAHDNLPVSRRHEYAVYAYDRRDGTLRWKKTLNDALPHEGAHRSGSLASASPVTDGKHLVVSFGTYGLYCLDFEGNLVWEKQLGKMNSKHGHGEGISPVLHQEKVVVNWDHEGQSFIVCFDVKNGEQLWKKTRDEFTSWSTPIVIQHDGIDQIIVPGTVRIRAYDLRDGATIWECGGMSANIVASPVAGDGMVFVGSSYEKRAMLGIVLNGASGDITDTKNVAWIRTTATPYVPSPLLFQGGLYYLRHYQGVISRVDMKSGADSPGPFRLRGVTDIYASPVAVADRIYITGLEGNTCVISAGEIPRILAINQLEDSFAASAAIVGEELFLRGEQNLYCIGREIQQ